MSRSIDARRCPACGALAVAPIRSPSLEKLRRAAEASVRAQLGAPMDTHLFNYVMAFAALVLISVGIPGTASDLAMAVLGEVAVIGVTLLVNRTLLREQVELLDADRARRARLVSERTRELADRHRWGWRCAECGGRFGGAESTSTAA